MIIRLKKSVSALVLLAGKDGIVLSCLIIPSITENIEISEPLIEEKTQDVTEEKTELATEETSKVTATVKPSE